MFYKKGDLRNFVKFTGKHLCQSLFFNKVAGLRPETCNFIKKETLAQVISGEFYEISKNTIFTEHLWATASDHTIRTRKQFHSLILYKICYVRPSRIKNCLFVFSVYLTFHSCSVVS